MQLYSLISGQTLSEFPRNRFCQLAGLARIESELKSHHAQGAQQKMSKSIRRSTAYTFAHNFANAYSLAYRLTHTFAPADAYLDPYRL